MYIFGQPLPLTFYRQINVHQIATQLLGKVLFTQMDGDITGGIIVETEAYDGITDKASHAYGGRLTKRTATMYRPGGIAYIYVCYGIHALFNVVTGIEGVPQAVLVRGIEPIYGLDMMLKRRRMTHLKTNLTAGPGVLCQALGIHKSLNGQNLTEETIWIEDQNRTIARQDIIETTRIGVGYAEEHALLPWRYYIKGNAYVSRP